MEYQISCTTEKGTVNKEKVKRILTLLEKKGFSWEGKYSPSTKLKVGRFATISGVVLNTQTRIIRATSGRIIDIGEVDMKFIKNLPYQKFDKGAEFSPLRENLCGHLNA